MGKNDLKYFIPSGEFEVERLRILHEVFFSSTNRYLKLALVNQPQKNILDVGCGSGEMTRYISKQTNGRVKGIDADLDQISIAKSFTPVELENISYDIIDVYNLSKYNYFDTVYCRFLLHHLSSPERALSKLISTTRMGGYLVLGEPIMNGRWCYPNNSYYHKVYDLHLENKKQHYWDPNYGMRLIGTLQSFDEIEIIQYEHFRPVLTKEAHKRHHILVLDMFEQQFKEKKLISNQEFIKLRKEVEMIVKDPNTITDLFGLVLVVARKRT